MRANNSASRFILGAALVVNAAFAHDVISTKLTWSKEVSRIVYKRCLSCHREGGSAPFALETFEQARPWAKAIQEEVLTRRMPPWGAVKGFGEFRHDQGLTQEEVSIIADWVEGGAPEGDPSLLPERPTKFTPPARATGKPMPVSKALRLTEPTRLVALRTSRPTQVVAEVPGGATEPLLWVSEPLKSPRTFVLAKPLVLPVGATIRATGPVTVIVAESSPSR